MTTRTLAFDLPEDFVDDLGSLEELSSKAKQAFVLELLREVRISQGKAAELLGISRYDIMDLMAEHQIPIGPVTPDEIEQEMETVRRLSEERRRRDRDKQ